MKKVDFRNLIERLDKAKNLIDPEIQTNHPAMKELFQILAYNLMDESERAMWDNHYYSGGKVDPEAAWFAFGEQDTPNHAPDEVLDTLYTGLMDDVQLADFEDERKNGMDARTYYNRYIKQYASPAMNKLATAFDMFLKKKTPKKPVKFLSPEEFKAMSPQNREKNFDRALLCLKYWK